MPPKLSLTLLSLSLLLLCTAHPSPPSAAPLPNALRPPLVRLAPPSTKLTREDFPPNMNFFAAAACCARGPGCWERHARNSLLCVEGRWMTAQSTACQQAACFYCNISEVNRKHPVCHAIAILKNCFNAVPPYPTQPKNYLWPTVSPSADWDGRPNDNISTSPSPSLVPLCSDLQVSPSSSTSPTKSSSPSVTPSPSASTSSIPSPSTTASTTQAPPSQSQSAVPSETPSTSLVPPSPSSSATSSSSPLSSSSTTGTCAHHAGVSGTVVIPAAHFPLSSPSNWARTHDGTAVTYKPSGGPGINSAETGSPFCVSFSTDTAGIYYFTILSSAPHWTEHNDAWFRFPGAPGFSRFRPQSRSVLRASTAWLKGYQNEGLDIVADYLLNVDFDGHQLLTPWLEAGSDKRYEVCVSGRSSKYSIYKIVLRKCPEGTESEWPDNVGRCSRFNAEVGGGIGDLADSPCVV